LIHNPLKLLLTFTSLLIFVNGCTVVDVQKIDVEKYQVMNVCIKHNSLVKVGDFVDVVRTCLSDYGVTSKVYKDNIDDEQCEYILTYTARRSWDFVPYLTLANIAINKGHEIVAKASYKHRGGSFSWAFNKWAGTESKITPIMDKLLIDYSKVTR